MKGRTKIIIAVITAIGTAIGGYSAAAISNNINNSVVVNVNGETVDVNKSNSDDLQNIIDGLENDKKELTDENTKLSSEIKNSVTANLKDVKLIIDGVDSGVGSKESVAVINNNNYYSEAFVKSLTEGKDFSIDLDSGKAYLGDKKAESAKLLDVCPTPVVSGSDVSILTEAISMSSESYYEGFSIHANSTEYAIFNVKGEYDNLNFLVGHIDESAMNTCTLKIYLSDDNGKFNKSPEKTVIINPEDLPQQVSIELKKTKQIKFEVSPKGYSGKWGFVNLYLD